MTKPEHHAVVSALNQKMTFLGVERGIALLILTVGLLLLMVTRSGLSAFAVVVLLAVIARIQHAIDPLFFEAWSKAFFLRWMYRADRRVS